MLPGETTVDVRILVDRSIVEIFIMGGRIVFTQAAVTSVYNDPYHIPALTSDTAVSLHTGTPLAVSYNVYYMGCGWDEIPYTDHPRM